MTAGFRDLKTGDGNIKVTFQQDVEGNIFCLKCNKAKSTDKWCTHLEHIITKNLDGVFFWEDIAEISVTAQEAGEHEVMVPMFPTNEFWAHVVLTPHQNANAYVATNATPGQAINYICLLAPGEGRNVLRSVIVEISRGIGSKLNCKSTTHWKQVAKDKGKDIAKGPNHELMDWTSIAMSGMCLACNIATQSLSFASAWTSL